MEPHHVHDHEFKSAENRTLVRPQRVYDAGTPWFTKTVTTDAVQQIQTIVESGNPGNVVLFGLKGGTWEYSFDPRPKWDRKFKRKVMDSPRQSFLFFQSS